MKVYDAASIRTSRVVGHTGSGKTQLTSAVLFDAGMVNRWARSTRATPSRISTRRRSPASTRVGQHRLRRVEQDEINLIDTPGSRTSSATLALRCASRMASLVRVDAVSGPEVQTEKLWRKLTRRSSRASSC